MKMPEVKIETLFHDKILLYNDLLEVLDWEKKSILNLDVDALWKISDQKKKLSIKIEAVRQSILNVLTDASIPHDMDLVSFQTSKVLGMMPEPIRERLGKAHVTLVSLKNEIRGRLEENKRFVGEYLDVLDELIGIITGNGSTGPIYGRRPHPEKFNTNLLLHKAV